MGSRRRDLDRQCRRARPLRRALDGVEPERGVEARRPELDQLATERPHLLERQVQVLTSPYHRVVGIGQGHAEAQEPEPAALPPDLTSHDARVGASHLHRHGVVVLDALGLAQPTRACRIDPFRIGKTCVLKVSSGARLGGAALGRELSQVPPGDAGAERIAGDAQPVRAPTDVPAGLFEDVEVAVSEIARARHGGRHADRRGAARGGTRRQVIALEVLGADDRAGREDDRILDHVPQPASIVGPESLLQARASVGTQLLRRQPEVSAGLAHEFFRERNDVRRPIPQGWEGEPDGQPTQQVGPEAPFPRRHGEVDVSRADDPHIDGHGGRQPDHGDEALVDHLQQPGLYRFGERADLVEQDRAVVRRPEVA